MALFPHLFLRIGFLAFPVFFLPFFSGSSLRLFALRFPFSAPPPPLFPSCLQTRRGGGRKKGGGEGEIKMMAEGVFRERRRRVGWLPRILIDGERAEKGGAGDKKNDGRFRTADGSSSLALLFQGPPTFVEFSSGQRRRGRRKFSSIFQGDSTFIFFSISSSRGKRFQTLEYFIPFRRVFLLL